MLTLAVPMWQERLKARPWADLVPRSREIADIVASHGDVILYRGKKTGETAAAFNALAEGLAILSFAPGGVRFMGCCWTDRHPDTAHRGIAEPTRGACDLPLLQRAIKDVQDR